MANSSSDETNLPPFDRARAGRWLAPWQVREWYHRATIQGTGNIPEGGALLVSNHGRLDFDSLILMRLLTRNTGRPVRSLGERMLFGNPLTAGLAHAIGAVEGTQDNAHRLLTNNELVLNYPGGVHEIFRSHFRRDTVDWGGRTGFAKAAILSQKPVVPIASFGINSGHIFLTSGRWLGTFLYRGVLRLGPPYDDYRDPLTLGLIPFPLPYSTAVHFPWPCKIRYVVGEPLQPPASSAADPDLPILATTFARQCEQALQKMLGWKP